MAMNNFIFENSTKIYFGKGCVKEYLACLLKHYGKNVMFAYGGDSVRDNGAYGEIMAGLLKAGKNVTEFSDIGENPTYGKVMEGAGLAKENNIETTKFSNSPLHIFCSKYAFLSQRA